jgi:membrane protein required for colicin V production
MAWVDWAIVIVLLITVLQGLEQGIIRSVCSLGGLAAGLILAAWNYAWLGALIVHLVRFDALANTIAFLLIAILVMWLVGRLGGILSAAVHRIGLGCLDRIAGAVFGFFKGALLVTLCILVTLAFFPSSHWLSRARLPRRFFGVCHLSMRTSPAELKMRIQRGLDMLERESPQWLHPGSGSGKV